MGRPLHRTLRLRQPTRLPPQHLPSPIPTTPPLPPRRELQRQDRPTHPPLHGNPRKKDRNQGKKHPTRQPKTLVPRHAQNARTRQIQRRPQILPKHRKPRQHQTPLPPQHDLTRLHPRRHEKPHVPHLPRNGPKPRNLQILPAPLLLQLHRNLQPPGQERVPFV